MFDRSNTNICRTVFSLPSSVKEGITQLSAIETMRSGSKSITGVIADALDWYFGLPEDRRAIPRLPNTPLAHYTVRLPKEAREKLRIAACEAQLVSSMPVSMNAVFIAALSSYLELKLPSFVSPYK